MQLIMCYLDKQSSSKLKGKWGGKVFIQLFLNMFRNFAVFLDQEICKQYITYSETKTDIVMKVRKVKSKSDNVFNELC